LPASGCEMIANVRRLATSSRMSMATRSIRLRPQAYSSADQLDRTSAARD
jgi:hypothetical protein